MDGDKKWSTGDWLVLEGGVIDGLYYSDNDTVILQGDGIISNGDAADFQLFVVGRLLSILFHDNNGNNLWDNGEDIVIDVNHNRIFNP